MYIYHPAFLSALGLAVPNYSPYLVNSQIYLDCFAGYVWIALFLSSS